MPLLQSDAVSSSTDELAGNWLHRFHPQNRRRILLISPKYSPSFGTFQHAFPLLGVAAFMPPQGLLLIGALLPREW
jgi:hopanoid C-2 methylase